MDAPTVGARVRFTERAVPEVAIEVPPPLPKEPANTGYVAQLEGDMVKVMFDDGRVIWVTKDTLDPADEEGT